MAIILQFACFVLDLCFIAATANAGSLDASGNEPAPASASASGAGLGPTTSGDALATFGVLSALARASEACQGRRGTLDAAASERRRSLQRTQRGL